MAKSGKDSEQAEVETERVGAMKIRVAKSGDRETLLIDGKPHGYRKLPNGYLLEDNFYVEPSKTLMAAAKAFAAQKQGANRKKDDDE